MRLYDALGEMERFPSPFGVRVLKYSIGGHKNGKDEIVSVPFRGSCSEIKPAARDKLLSGWGFRPLSGFVF